MTMHAPAATPHTMFDNGAPVPLSTEETSVPQRLDPLERRAVSDLRPHPAVTAHGITLELDKLSASAQARDRGMNEPIEITSSGYILDGLDRWALAQADGRAAVLCRVRELSEQEALIWLLQRQQPSSGLNQFVRILLALELEDWLAQQSKENQRVGGALKGSSNLTNLRLDVRERIAQIAGASAGNVSKVKHLKRSAHPSLAAALKAREVSIHQAWKWVCQSGDGGKSALEEFSSHRDIHRTISRLVRTHKKRKSPMADGFEQIREGLRSLKQSGSAVSTAIWAGLLREAQA